MKKKIIFLMVVILTACIYCGCKGYLGSSDRDIDSRLISLYGDSDVPTEIVCDKETGVLYLVGYRAGICVMVDENGKPLVCKDFKETN